MPASLPTLPADIDAVVRHALTEDIGGGDITACLIPADAEAHGRVIVREAAVLCGTAWFDAVFRQLDRRVQVIWQARDGERLRPNQTLCQLRGPARSLLSGERAALNFLQTLSATATQTRRYVDAIVNTGARLLDTRKTLPGLRSAQKYATACGGARNHRMGLFDAFLIKENHILAAGGIAQAVSRAREIAPGKPVEVEVENLMELQQALDAGADTVMLDNMDLAMMREAVVLTAGRSRLEASGNVNLDTLRAIAGTGVDYISVGAITKDVQAVDLSLRLLG
ncbi:MAG: carboxylating nicotinate-nucleotide diphosphorylase [Gammaproteobacteria bacterium]|nr:carboxylating nicotinate-nucleotide diphosphorylase [Gammaproteobacteria bacterium]MCF6364308.1 carboxylating nicotinate-nucleotide diphosphorylase [Gammaproteobacteria bacterium]